MVEAPGLMTCWPPIGLSYGYFSECLLLFGSQYKRLGHRFDEDQILATRELDNKNLRIQVPLETKTKKWFCQ